MSRTPEFAGDVASSDPKAAAQLLPLVYEELRRIAAHKMANEAAGQTLQPTALVHEAWLRVAGTAERPWNDRKHFIGVAAEAMRCILVDRARRRTAAKRGGNAQAGKAQLSDEIDIPAPEADDQLLLVNDALEKFARVDPRKAELVKLRYFAGFSFEDAAETLGIAIPTAKQWWAFSRAWLRVAISSSSGD
jgi:RNA polymerase sigma factor (TIGR02999 family)